MGCVGELAELARDEERDLFADVDRVVPDPLEGPCREFMCIPVEGARVVGELGDLEVHVAVQAVDGVVHLLQRGAELEVAAAERVHRDAHHLDHDVPHLADLLHDRRSGACPW